MLASHLEGFRSVQSSIVTRVGLFKALIALQSSVRFIRTVTRLFQNGPETANMLQSNDAPVNGRSGQIQKLDTAHTDLGKQKSLYHCCCLLMSR